jgi:hypothetical protein
MRGLARILLLATAVMLSARQAGAAWEDRPGWQRAGYNVLAGVENVVPITSALAAPRCLPGYIVCKALFAGFSVVAAGEQLFFSGGADMDQTRAVLHRGFAGDWVLTGAHAAGDDTPEVLPDPGPATSAPPPPDNPS